MSAPLLFRSTNRSAPAVGLAAALLQGQAPDRGLYLPTEIPRLDLSALASLRGRPYADVAFAVVRIFTAGVFDDAQFSRLCDDAYKFEVPLEQVAPRRFLLRLDRGPTASFKDFAARMMARWMGALAGRDPRPLVILVATSGDTGSAVAQAYLGVPNVHIVVLFPPAEVSNRQRRQMTTLGRNVTPIAVDGQFDDCQALVKRAFGDAELARIRLTSANSINIGRLLPQIVYYVYAHVNLTAGPDDEIVFAVPSGNFGNMMGAVLARRMGLPIRRLIIATNANDEFPRFLETGRYEKIAPSRVCISNAMNVGHPSNLARLVDLYGGWMDETGQVRETPDLDALRRDIFAVSVSDAQTREVIRRVHQQYGAILEPHGAVGWAGVEAWERTHPDEAQRLVVSVETAHPAKFPDEIESTLGVCPEVPAALTALEDRPEHYERLTTDYDAFARFLKDRFGA